jgi:hypothetical protein
MPADSRRTLAKLSSAAVATLAAALCLTSPGCVRNVPQASHSGKDQRPKAAQKIVLDDDGEARTRKDIVTYPGGDRVDWKVFEVPADKFGTLKLALQFEPPRPGLDVAFNVYDQYYHRIARAKPSPGSGRRTKRVTLKDVEAGKYYVQIYAPRRTDAGTYRLRVRFNEAPRVAEAAPKGPTEIPDPPTLPAVPEPVDPTTQPPPVDPIAPPPVAVDPVKARIVKYQVSSGGSLIVTVDKGKNAGIENGWKGQVLASSGKALEGGDFTITKVTSGEAVGKVSLSVDQVKANRKVLLLPPQ